MVALAHPPQAVFDALVDPTRREILELLRPRRRTAGDIADHFPAISRPAVSQHLRVLLGARLVTQRAEGRRRVYDLNPTALRQVDRWLERYRVFWTDRLAALKRLAEQPGR